MLLLSSHCAGVLTLHLLDYLANYVTANAPTGWTLPAFPWYGSKLAPWILHISAAATQCKLLAHRAHPAALGC